MDRVARRAVSPTSPAVRVRLLSARRALSAVERGAQLLFVVDSRTTTLDHAAATHVVRSTGAVFALSGSGGRERQCIG